MHNSEFIKEFVEEAQIHIDCMETGLIKMEAGSGGTDTINDIFRAAHSVKGTAGFFSLKNIVRLTHAMENLLGEIRGGSLAVNKEIIDILLSANDSLKAMTGDVENSETVDISAHVDRIGAVLNSLSPGRKGNKGQCPAPAEPVRESDVAAADICLDRDAQDSQGAPSAVAPPCDPSGESGCRTFVEGKVLTFYLCGQLFGLDITAVKEINRNIEYTPVPDAPAHIIGLLNMRGQVVTLFDLAGLMGYGQNSQKGRSTCIILKCLPGDSDYIGFLIDRLGSVVDVEEDICEPPPANMGGNENRFLFEVVKLRDELLMVIDHRIIFEQG